MEQNSDEELDNKEEEPRCARWNCFGNVTSKKVLIVLFGLVGCCYAATFSYFNGTITTMEKRFGMPSRITGNRTLKGLFFLATLYQQTGVVSIGNDITKLLASVALNYYASRGHRPRWMSFGLCCVAAFCFLNALPHAVYGPGEDALRLTVEHSTEHDGHAKSHDTSRRERSELCAPEDDNQCRSSDGGGGGGDSTIVPPVIWFTSQFISGIGGVLLYSLGYSYLDDNVKKSKSPIAISSTYIMRMLGPAFGYALVSMCLKIYISPGLTPTIDNLDPRWLGAWWLGWIILGVMIFASASVMYLLPKSLPKATARKKNQILSNMNEQETSLKDMFDTVKRLLKNRVYVSKLMATILHVFAFVPFKTFLPKYIETQYKKSASAASFITGTVGLIFSAIGVMIAGVTVQRLKPKARHMAIWNTIIDVLRIFGVVAYLFLGCGAIDEQTEQFGGEKCDTKCNCDFVKFSPVCGIDNQTFISPCHAGCTEKESLDRGRQLYSNCSCVVPTNMDTSPYDYGYAFSGACATDCANKFYAFVAIICIMKFVGSLGRITSFLVSIRCVEERDKTVSLGINMTALSLFALIPAPILFGYIIDSTCLVWGRTCEGTGNCWLFDSTLMRTRLIGTSSVFLVLELVFDVAIWHGVKGLDVFGEAEERELELQNAAK